jgi:hypothetical protein
MSFFFIDVTDYQASSFKISQHPGPEIKTASFAKFRQQITAINRHALAGLGTYL